MMFSSLENEYCFMFMRQIVPDEVVKVDDSQLNDVEKSDTKLADTALFGNFL